MTIGFSIIGEMSKEQLIDEIVEHQRKAMRLLEIEQLKAHVIDFRMAETRKRLEEEAGIRVHHGILGTHVCTEDCEGHE